MKSIRPKVVLTYPIHPEVIRTELQPHVRVAISRRQDLSDLPELLADADGLITRVFDPVDETLLRRAPRLKVVANFGVGIDNIDLPACGKRGIVVCNTPDVLTRATAELALALLLAAARRVPEGERLCRTGQWKGWEPGQLLGLELAGRRAVLVGRGRIGRATERLFRAVGLRTSWITRKDSEATIQKKLAQAQILSLHFSLNPSTRHWLNRERLHCLPGDAIVVNTTRGPTIDERALIEALRKRQIFAAALDVYEKEPHIPAALRKLPNVVLLPHLGSATEEARRGMARLAVAGVLGVLGGKRPPNQVKT